MRTRVVITFFALRREDNRNVIAEMAANSSMGDFAAKTHLVVVPCVIFSSHLSVYHFRLSPLLTLCIFKS